MSISIIKSLRLYRSIHQKAWTNWHHLRCILLATILFNFLLPTLIHAQPTQEETRTIGEVTQGSLLLRTTEPDRFLPAPTLHTDVAITVTGLIARATVRQQFNNANQEWAEGIYVFPLSETAAVDHLRMIIGERIIEGQIQERGQAKKTYEQAKKSGHRASLLEQERPNIFTASVANIGPGETIIVEIEYQETIRYDQDQFHLRFPMVIGPRYITGNPRLIKEEISSMDGQGWAMNTHQIPDASRITPPVQHPDEGSLNPISLTIDLAPGFSLAQLKSAYHPIHINEDKDGSYHISLQGGKIPADRDFELIWQPVKHKAPKAALLTQQKHGSSFGLIMVMPPVTQTDEHPSFSRDVIFVIDTSGSMHGTSINQAKAALHLALSHLTSQDRFNIIQFNNTTQTLFSSSRTVTQAHIQQAMQYVDHLIAEGGTEMLPALERALVETEETDRLRQVIFLTDGQIGNEKQLFEIIRQRLGQSRLFPIGIGSAPNSHFMRKAAEFGGGSFTYIGKIKEVKEKMDRLFQKLEHPALTDISVELPPSSEIEMVPERILDLYLGEPVTVVMKSKNLPDHILVKGRFGETHWETTLSLNQGSQREGIDVFWARKKIASLMDKQIGGEKQEAIRQQVIDLAIQHHLVSRHTSLVAVDITPARSQDRALHTHPLKTNLPHGQDYTAIFGLAQGATPGPLHLVMGMLFLLLAGGIYQLAKQKR